MAKKPRWPKDVQHTIKALFSVENYLSDGCGYYLAQWHQDFDKELIKVARRLKRAALKDAENERELA